MSNAFQKALKKEQNETAQRHLLAFYANRVKLGKIVSFHKVEFDKDNILSQILQFTGCDTVIEKEPNSFVFVEEKICSKSDYLFFEIEMYSYKQQKYVAGWAVSPYKKTDLLSYYIADVGLFILPFKELREWLLENKKALPKHHSKEGRGKQSNINLRVPIAIIRETFPNCYIPIEELELLASTISHKSKEDML